MPSMITTACNIGMKLSTPGMITSLQGVVNSLFDSRSSAPGNTGRASRCADAIQHITGHHAQPSSWAGLTALSDDVGKWPMSAP
jgi:hypothetical protein